MKALYAMGCRLAKDAGLTKGPQKDTASDSSTDTSGQRATRSDDHAASNWSPSEENSRPRHSSADTAAVKKPLEKLKAGHKV